MSDALNVTPNTAANITVHVPTAFRRFTDGKPKFVCIAADLDGLLTYVSASLPELAAQIKDESGKLRRFINVYVNDEDIRFLEKGWTLKDGDEVFLVPSIAGGRD